MIFLLHEKAQSPQLFIISVSKLTWKWTTYGQFIQFGSITTKVQVFIILCNGRSWSWCPTLQSLGSDLPCGIALLKLSRDLLLQLVPSCYRFVARCLSLYWIEEFSRSFQIKDFIRLMWFLIPKHDCFFKVKKPKPMYLDKINKYLLFLVITHTNIIRRKVYV